MEPRNSKLEDRLREIALTRPQDMSVEEDLIRLLEAARIGAREMADATACGDFTQWEPEAPGPLSEDNNDESDVVGDVIDDLRSEIAALRDKLSRAEGERDELDRWNRSVAVCAEHVTDIVNGACRVCEIHDLLAHNDRHHENERRLERERDEARADLAEQLDERAMERERLAQAKADCARLRAALEEIASDRNIYAGHGNITVIPLLRAEEAMHAAREVLQATSGEALEAVREAQRWLQGLPNVEPGSVNTIIIALAKHFGEPEDKP